MPMPGTRSEAAPDAPRRRGMDNISRVDSGATHGWTVRFQRDGQKHGRFFSDARYDGGAEGALRAARRWRNRMRKELGPAADADASRMHTREARERNRRAVSQTGVTGISVQARPFATRRVPYVTAYWVDGEGRRRQTSFSTERHGVDGALALAARARAETSEWYGAPRQSPKALADAARARVHELVGRLA